MIVFGLLLSGVLAGEPTSTLTEWTGALEQLGATLYPSADDFQAMEHLVGQLKREYPDEPATRYWRGMDADRRGEIEEAMDHWKRAVEATSRSKDADSWRARAAVRLGYAKLSDFDAEEAERWAERAVALVPHNARGYQLLADASLRTGRITATLEILRGASEQHSDPSIRATYFDLLAQMGDWSTLDRATRAELAASPASPEAHHYRGRFADAQGDSLGGFLHHFVAAMGGSTESPTHRSSLDRLQQGGQPTDPVGGVGGAGAAADRVDAGPRRDLEILTRAYYGYDRPESAAEILTLLEGVKLEGTEEVRRVTVGHLKAGALAARGRWPEAEATWREILGVWPNYLPALVGLAEALEAQSTADTEPEKAANSNARLKEADRLLEQARHLEPASEPVRRIDRLGGRFRITKEGVRVLAVVPGSVLERFGLAQGDEILALDGVLLGTLPPADRLRLARLFQGGTLHYRTAGGEERQEEVPIVLFPY